MFRQNKSINDQTKSVFFRCDDICTMLVVDKIMWDDGDINYTISMQTSDYYDVNTIRNRIRRAWNALFGRRISFNDMYTDDENRLRQFVEELKQLIDG